MTQAAIDHRPVRLRRICLALAFVVLAVFGVIAVLLPRGETAAVVGPADQLSFFGIGLLIAAGVLVFTRFRVRADATGIWVRNALGERYFPWEVVVGIDLPAGGTWAQLELHDDKLVGLLALQTSDGDLTVDVVIALRRLLKESRG